MYNTIALKGKILARTLRRIIKPCGTEYRYLYHCFIFPNMLSTVASSSFYHSRNKIKNSEMVPDR